MNPRGFRQAFVTGADGGEVLMDDRFRRSSTLRLVAQQPANEADIRRGVDENANVEQGGQGRRAQQVRAFDDDDLGGRHRFAARFASMMDEGVEGGGHAAPGLEVGQIGNQQIVIASGDIVKVMRRGVEARHGRRVQIVGILAQQRGDALRQRGNQGFGQGALAGARAAGDGDQYGHGRLIHPDAAGCKP